ncbi:MAG: alpha/beta hydrolase, partial [Bacteroidota bacterium]
MNSHVKKLPSIHNCVYTIERTFMKNVLLLHGALGSKEQLEGIAKELSGKFKVHSINFGGHGGYATDHPFSIDFFTDEVFQYLEKYKLEQVSIFGYSMGGYVALNLASKQPKKVERIVTYGTKFNWSTETSAKEVKMLNPHMI